LIADFSVTLSSGVTTAVPSFAAALSALASNKVITYNNTQQQVISLNVKTKDGSGK